MNQFIKILVLCSIGLLSGCGFHLRSATSLPPQLHKMYLATDNPYGDFTLTFKKSLQDAGIELTNAANLAKVTLTLTYNYAATTTSTGTSTQARLYTLNYAAITTLQNTQGKNIIGPFTTSVSRNLTLAPYEVFEVSTQVDTVKQELQTELATKIINILGSKNSFAVLATAP